MAYNTTTWQADSNTKANNATIGSNIYVYKSMHGGFQSWGTSGGDSTNLIFIPMFEGNETESPNVGQYNIYTWATGGSLLKLYYVSSEIDDMSGVTLIVKSYRYRPDGSTNTGVIDTISNWTELSTGTVTPQNTDRGVLVTFAETDSSYNAGDLMCIGMQVTSGGNDFDTNSRTTFTIIIKEDWNDIISSNV